MPNNMVCGVQLFPDTAIFNRVCADLPVHGQSSTWISSLGTGIISNLNWNNGSGTIVNIFNSKNSGIAPITISSPALSDTGGFLVPDSFQVDTNYQIICLDVWTKTLTELFGVTKVGNVYQCQQAASYNLSTLQSRIYPFGTLGLPVLPLLPRYDEIYVNGVIKHALNIQVSTAQNALPLWPASQSNGTGSSSYPPVGARMRLQASFNIPAFTTNPYVQILLTCLQVYGAFVVFQQGTANCAIYSTQDSRWASPFLGGTTALPAISNFEFVDESRLMTSISSYGV